MLKQTIHPGFGILSFTPYPKATFANNAVPGLAAVLWSAFSATGNVVVTALLIYKLFAARRRELEAQPEGPFYPPLHRALIIILVESAAPLALSGLLLVIGSVIMLSHESNEMDWFEIRLSAFMLIVQALFLLFGVSDFYISLFTSPAKRTCRRYHL